MNMFYTEIGKTIELLLMQYGEISLKYNEDKWELKYNNNKGRERVIKGKTLDEVCFKISIPYSNELYSKIRKQRLEWIEYFKNRDEIDEKNLIFNVLNMLKISNENEGNYLLEDEKYKEYMKKIDERLNILKNMLQTKMPKKMIADLYMKKGIKFEKIKDKLNNVNRVFTYEEILILLNEFENVKDEIQDLLRKYEQIKKDFRVLRKTVNKKHFERILKANGVEFSYPTILKLYSKGKFPVLSAKKIVGLYNVIEKIKKGEVE